MPRKVFVTSDLHLGHAKVAEARGFSSVSEHDDFIIEQHNDVVRPTDVIWHLGDVVFGVSTNLKLLARLNGIKHLVLGNHEHHDVSRYQTYFNRIVSTMILRERFLLSHVPVHPVMLKGHLNVHGHIHINTPRPKIWDPGNYYNVNCEFHMYRPVDIDQILQQGGPLPC